MSLRKDNKKSSQVNDILIDLPSEDSFYDPKNEERFGRIFMNETFDLPLQEVFDCIFEYKRFHDEFMKRRNILSKKKILNSIFLIRK